MPASGTCACSRMAGRSSPRITRSRRNGSTPCSSPRTASKCSRSARVGGTSPVAGDPYLLDEEVPSAPRPMHWPFLAKLPQLLAEAHGSPAAYREVLKQGHEDLKARFFSEESVDILVHARPMLVDAVLREVIRIQFAE